MIDAAASTNRGFLLALWVGIALHLVGDVIDLRWHSRHDVETSFESWGNQLQAHWLLWIGALVTLVVAVVVLRTDTAVGKHAYRLVAAMALLYAASSGWHGWEHANANDPALPHLLLAISKLGMIAGAVWASVLVRRADVGRRQRQPA